MEKARLTKYCDRHSVAGRWVLVAPSVKNIRNVIVIPALAESEYLFQTLSSLAGIDGNDAAESLVICVINNTEGHTGDKRIIRDNADTLSILRMLVDGRKKACVTSPCVPKRHRRAREIIMDSGLTVGYVDAATAGNELPARSGGVGLARKIGFDNALAFVAGASLDDAVFFSLDADTVVEANYISAVRSHYDARKPAAVLISFGHVAADPAEDETPIVSYETFLRYYVLGLFYAGSPYAYHAIGSTVTVPATGYLSVGGMNRRKAGEDFYFLNKVRKQGPIDTVTRTRVYPSARVSERVPFGTGRRMKTYENGERRDRYVYDPAVFTVLKEWLSTVTDETSVGGTLLLSRARSIHPRLADFLEESGFMPLWKRLENNSGGNEQQLRRHFHGWFDAFRTLKLVHYLTERTFPKRPLFESVAALLNRMESDISVTGVPLPAAHDGRGILNAVKAFEEKIYEPRQVPPAAG